MNMSLDKSSRLGATSRNHYLSEMTGVQIIKFIPSLFFLFVCLVITTSSISPPTLTSPQLFLLLYSRGHGTCLTVVN